MSLPRRRRWFVESLPRNILADTGPLFALIHAGDPDHARAVQFAGTFTGLLITTWPVVTEAAYLLDKYDHRGVEKLLGMVLDGQLLVADLDARDVEYRHDFSRYRTRNRKAFTNHFPERA
jgi:predicted nucleic acid-binding protein